jgi:hypothetical protein
MRQTKKDLLLPEHHRQIEQLLDEVKSEVRRNDPRRLCGYWTRFERELTDHMAAEEELVIPGYAKHHPVEARRLLDEHTQLRALLTDAGVQTDLHCIRVELIDELVEKLREHARQEDATVYVWASQHLPGWANVLQIIRERAERVPTDVRGLADELRLQVHLAGMDAAQQLATIRKDTEKLARSVGAVPQRALDDLRHQLQHLKDGLPKR